MLAGPAAEHGRLVLLQIRRDMLIVVLVGDRALRLPVTVAPLDKLPGDRDADRADPAITARERDLLKRPVHRDGFRRLGERRVLPRARPRLRMGGERDSEDGTQEAFDDVVCFHDVSFFDDLSVVVLEDGCPRVWIFNMEHARS